MGRMSRAKGAGGERELAAQLRAITGWEIKRRVRQHEGDSDLEGVPGWSVECKRHADATRGDIRGWWVQAVEQAKRGNTVPVLFFRRNRDEWRAVWPLAAGPEWASEYEYSVEGSLDAWAFAARERGLIGGR